MPDYKQLFTGTYLASADLGEKTPTVKIARVVIELVEDEKKKDAKGKPLQRKRWILYFERAEKGLLLNRTNAELIVALTQKVKGLPLQEAGKTESWVGISVTLAARDVKLGGEWVKGLRVVGSPDLQAPLKVEVRLPKKKPQDHVLQATVKGQPLQLQQAEREEPPADEPPREPGSDDND